MLTYVVSVESAVGPFPIFASESGSSAQRAAFGLSQDHPEALITTTPIDLSETALTGRSLLMVPSPIPLRQADGLVEVLASEGERVYNSALVFNPHGDCVARYDKIHLFRFDNGQERFDESRVLEPGTQPVLFELPARDGQRWRIGLSICYDLRFPELYRAYAAQGADLLLVPSAFTVTTGQAHWELLLRARAVENLAAA